MLTYNSQKANSRYPDRIYLYPYFIHHIKTLLLCCFKLSLVHKYKFTAIAHPRLKQYNRNRDNFDTSFMWTLPNFSIITNSTQR